MFDEIANRCVSERSSGDFRQLRPYLPRLLTSNTVVWRTQWRAKTKCNRVMNACPMKNKDEHVKMPQRKVQQPQLNWLSPLEFNDHGSSMASPRIFILQRRVVELLSFCTEERNMQPEPLDQRYHIPIFALDRHCKHRYLRSILEAKLGTRHHCMIHL